MLLFGISLVVAAAFGRRLSAAHPACDWNAVSTLERGMSYQPKAT